MEGAPLSHERRLLKCTGVWGGGGGGGERCAQNWHNSEDTKCMIEHATTPSVAACSDSIPGGAGSSVSIPFSPGTETSSP